MKTFFFKIVPPAFALMLAVTASLAFTPANDTSLVQGYIQVLDETGFIVGCDESIICSTGSDQECTVGVGTPSQVFGLQYSSATSCTRVLYRP
ncbi:DUF6520 family protein [Flavivirga amylovorans]|uniref:DUF6520 family protein n=1 Tax=Flavivirga amylovorans TaxID=870486 RepID=A0ABT8X6N1_9FLAO|nr:DUF6520 family protein [Flavivirga amylovorans]MDO5989541.1 DUF6520 family protein [Flavivirga amylovorans]